MNRVISSPILLLLIGGLVCLVPIPAGAVDAPPIVWTHALGGSGWDDAYAVETTADGGYLVAGETDSIDGDVTGVQGSSDAWILKLNATGGLVWQRCLGGTDYDFADAVQTADGGYAVAGCAYSTDGNVSGNHGNGDAWVVRLDAAGTLLWQKALGGSGLDTASAVQQTADGGYIVAGYTESNDGDVSGNHGFYDIWVVKLDTVGGLVWQTCLGGSEDDDNPDVQQTADGGYIVAGATRSTDGQVTGNHGQSDIWVGKLSPTGSLAWQRAFGGSGLEMAGTVERTSDGGFVVAGDSGSTDGDVTVNHGNTDVWVVRLDSSGGLAWQQSLGGSDNDYGRAARPTTDGGFIVGGYTFSNNGDVAGLHGSLGSDAWAVKLNATGGLSWQKALGGTGDDMAADVLQTADGGFVLAGNTLSDDGDVTARHGSQDAWVVRLAAAAGPAVVPVPPSTLLPTDTDGDGLCDDVNGNGRADFADVVLYFNQMSWIAANEPIGCFDYNANGRIDFADVVWLFNRL